MLPEEFVTKVKNLEVAEQRYLYYELTRSETGQQNAQTKGLINAFAAQTPQEKALVISKLQDVMHKILQQDHLNFMLQALQMKAAFHFTLPSTPIGTEEIIHIPKELAELVQCVPGTKTAWQLQTNPAISDLTLFKMIKWPEMYYGVLQRNNVACNMEKGEVHLTNNWQALFFKQELNELIQITGLKHTELSKELKLELSNNVTIS